MKIMLHKYIHARVRIVDLQAKYIIKGEHVSYMVSIGNTRATKGMSFSFI